MTAMQLVSVLMSSILLCGLAVAWFVARRDYQVDSFRQAMFELRDNMFDYAASGAITFDNPAYKHLRMLMNGLLRFGHRVTFWQIISMIALFKLFGVKSEGDPHREWAKNLASIGSEEVRNKLQDFHARALNLAVWQMLRSTCLSWPFLWWAVIAYAIREKKTPSVEMKQDAIRGSAVVAAAPTEWIEERAIACAA